MFPAGARAERHALVCKRQGLFVSRQHIARLCWISVLLSFPNSRDGFLLLKAPPDATLESKRWLTTDCTQSEPSIGWAQKAEAEEGENG